MRSSDGGRGVGVQNVIAVVAVRDSGCECGNGTVRGGRGRGCKRACGCVFCGCGVTA